VSGQCPLVLWWPSACPAPPSKAHKEASKTETMELIITSFLGWISIKLTDIISHRWPDSVPQTPMPCKHVPRAGRGRNRPLKVDKCIGPAAFSLASCCSLNRQAFYARVNVYVHVKRSSRSNGRQGPPNDGRGPWPSTLCPNNWPLPRKRVLSAGSWLG
jgi:hypothetical protein